uniref:CARD domain-containing protein n=1 Tax=Hucho hucho TaxID=62062 RepID=A0A4W5NT40_9TELE
EPNIKAICDNLLQKNVINKFERDSITQRMLDRAEMARQLVDTVTSKGNNASTLMIEALKQVDQHLCNEIERNLALANPTGVQAGAQGVRDSPPSKAKGSWKNCETIQN